MRLPSPSRRFCLGLAAALLTAGLSHAQTPPASTLERIRQTGVLRIGFGYAQPFAYIEANGTVTGYSIELCGRLAETLRVQLALPRLDIQYSRLAPNNRISQLNSGAIDIECGASTNSPERRASVTFGPSHFITDSRYVSLAANALRTIDDLRGKSVAVVLGTTNVGDIARLNRERRLNLSVVTTHTNQDAFDLITQGKVSAFPMDDVLLHMLVGASGNPDRYAVSDETLAPPQAYGFMMRRNDPDFVQAVDAALRNIYASPDMPALYDRWFNEPLPGSGVNLHLPMSPTLRRALFGADAG
ncbi:MAG TPA: amino acid ABC transporter substrate-binding protein [Bordetella sp.]